MQRTWDPVFADRYLIVAVIANLILIWLAASQVSSGNSRLASFAFAIMHARWHCMT